MPLTTHLHLARTLGRRFVLGLMGEVELKTRNRFTCQCMQELNHSILCIIYVHTQTELNDLQKKMSKITFGRYLILVPCTTTRTKILHICRCCFKLSD
jgi:hypothetical protein